MCWINGCLFIAGAAPLVLLYLLPLERFDQWFARRPGFSLFLVLAATSLLGAVGLIINDC